MPKNSSIAFDRHSFIAESRLEGVHRQCRLIFNMEIPGCDDADDYEWDF